MLATTTTKTVHWHAPAVIAVNRARARHRLAALSPEQVNRFLNGELLLFNANNPHWYDASVNAVCALLNSGKIEVFTGTQPAADVALTGTLLVTMTFGATAFGASSSGTATANAITSGTAGNTGTAGYFGLLESNGTTVVGTGSVASPSGGDLNFNSLSISSGATCSCSAFTITGG
jgi:hypothetical protein